MVFCNPVITFWSQGRLMKALRTVACYSFVHWQNSDLKSASQHEKPQISFFSKPTASKILFKIPLLSSFFLLKTKRSVKEASNALVLPLSLSTELTTRGGLLLNVQTYAQRLINSMSDGKKIDTLSWGISTNNQKFLRIIQKSFHGAAEVPLKEKIYPRFQSKDSCKTLTETS